MRLLNALLLALSISLAARADEFPASFQWPANWPPRVHDPSTIVSANGEYHLFSTGRGGLTRHSRDLATWTSGPPVFAASPVTVTNFLPAHHGWLWAPDVVRLNGRWLLYYSISEFGKNTSAIALASNATLDPADKDFLWRDDGIVIASERTDDFNCIDPSVFLDDDGRLWLAFGSFWSGIRLTELDPATGRRLAPGSPLQRLAWNHSIEAACLTKHAGEYFLFVNWGVCCRGTNSTYEIRVGRSGKISGPYLDREGCDLQSGGGAEFLASQGRFIGPGHAGILRDGTNEFVSFHFYDGSRRGAATLGLRRLNWGTNGWPVAGDWVSPASGTR